MASPFGVRMLFPMITRTLAPERDARMILGDCSFQLVQNIRLKERTQEEMEFKDGNLYVLVNEHQKQQDLFST